METDIARAFTQGLLDLAPFSQFALCILKRLIAAADKKVDISGQRLRAA